MKKVKKLPRFVLQDWMGEINFKRQTVILMAIRGPDAGFSEEVKKIVKWIRCLALHNADPAKDWMHTEDVPTIAEIKKRDRFAIDALPTHFVHHLCDALSTIGYKHPSFHIRGKAKELYDGIAHYLGLMPRDESQYEERLQDMSRTRGIR